MALINFSGLASGIDSNALIAAILDQNRQARITPLENRITELQDTNSAFEELTTLLDELKTVASRFRVLNGGSVSKLASSSDETVASVTAGNSASNSSFNLDVTQLASTATHSFNDSFSATDSAINSSIVGTGTLSVDIGQGSNLESISVDVDSSTTLDDIAAEINSKTDKAVATLVNTGTSSSPSYKLVVSSVNEGLDKGNLSITASSEITSAGSFQTATLDQATDAQFSISGIAGSITRSTNSISDVVPGLTLNLAKTGSTTVAVGVDSSTTTASLQEFVDSYNAVIEFIKENDTVTRIEDGDEVENIFAPLASTSLDNQIISSLKSALSGAGIDGDEVNILADLGITTTIDGTLDFDSEEFENALSKDPEAVEQITANLGENLAAVNGTISTYTQFNGLIDLAEESNNNSISSFKDRIAIVEDQLTRQEEALLGQFARLEANISQLQSQQTALTSILGGF